MWFICILCGVFVYMHAFLCGGRFMFCCVEIEFVYGSCFIVCVLCFVGLVWHCLTWSLLSLFWKLINRWKLFIPIKIFLSRYFCFLNWLQLFVGAFENTVLLFFSFNFLEFICLFSWLSLKFKNAYLSSDISLLPY